MGKLVLKDINSLQGTTPTGTINENSRKIRNAFDNTLSRDGEAPNAMLANLDMNDHRIINLPEPSSAEEPATKGYVDEVALGAGSFIILGSDADVTFDDVTADTVTATSATIGTETVTGALTVGSLAVGNSYTITDDANLTTITFATNDVNFYDKSTNAWSWWIGGTQELVLTASALQPGATDGLTLGNSSIMWSDLFLASGAVINFDSSDVTISHGANSLTFAGGNNFFGNAVGSTTNNGAPLGIAGANEWSDLFLGSGAVIGFNNNDVTLTHSTDMLTLGGGSFSRGAPVTKTTDFTLAANENWVISDRAASNTVTLPSAASFPGREVTIKTIQAQTVVSASSNVVPRTSATAGTAILAATDGAWATLVSDGTNWIIMAGTP